MGDQSESSAVLLNKSSINERNGIPPPDAKFYLRKRYLVAGLVFVGWGLLFLLRINLSISLIGMTSNKTVTIGNETFIKRAEYDLSTAQQGLILSSLSWGIFAAPLGALISGKFGGVATFGAGIALTAVLTILTPFFLQWNWKVYLVVRVFEGVFESFSVPTYADVFAQWSPPGERCRMMAGAFLGTIVGTVLGYPVCGIIAFHLDWRAVFYITGGICLVWYILWISFVARSPVEDNLISQIEKEFMISVNQHISKEKVIYPWKQILSSKAVLVFMNDRFVEAWSVSFLVYCLPIYINDLNDVNIQQIGFLSSIPHICAFVGLTGGCIAADFIRNRKILSITNVHKVFLIFSQTAAVVLLVIISFCASPVISVVCLSLFRLFYSVGSASIMVIPLDVGGRYAGFITAFGSMAMAVAYTLNPIIMGLMITNHSMAEWSRYFLLISVFNLWGGIVFYKYGSGNLQSWAVPGCKTKHIEQ